MLRLFLCSRLSQRMLIYQLLQNKPTADLDPARLHVFNGSLNYSIHIHGRPQKFFQMGAKPPTLKKVETFSARRTKNRPFFGVPKAQTKNVAVFRPF